MIRSFHIENFKSLESLDLELGRVTVLIGENGCGKSNILEAIAFVSAAAFERADHEFLAARGIRMVEPEFMYPAFERAAPQAVVARITSTSNVVRELHVAPSVEATNAWDATPLFSDAEVKRIRELLNELAQPKRGALKRAELKLDLARFQLHGIESLLRFLIYSPENSALRTFQAEGQILPLGIRGEGLFAFLKKLQGSEEGRAALAQISEQLQLLDWFRELHLAGDLAPGERTLRIGDRYLAEGLLFDQRSANEGFLFLLFYFALCIGPGTPSFFAVDNVDASLNPRLCAELTRRLVALAKRHDKQIVLTTHNPAVLDGLDLHDDEQRLLVVHRNRKGHTKVRRVEAPRVAEGETPVRLSEAFLRGYIGGLPKNF